MAWLEPVVATSIDFRPVDTSKDSQFRYMVETIDDLRTQLAEEYPYNRAAVRQYGLASGVRFKDLRFDPYDELKSGEVKAELPVIQWQSKMWHKGQAFYQPNIIKMNALLDIEQALNTFRHEYAHMATYYIARSATHHGKPWKQWASIVGAVPRRVWGYNTLYNWKHRKDYPKIDKKLWFDPIAKIEGELPHETLYEGRKIADRYLKKGGDIIKRLVALHPKPYVAVFIATNPNISLMAKAEMLSADVLPAKTGKNLSAFKDRLAEKISMSQESKHKTGNDKLIIDSTGTLKRHDSDFEPTYSYNKTGNTYDLDLGLTSDNVDYLVRKNPRLLDAKRESYQRIIDENIDNIANNPELQETFKRFISDTDRALANQQDVEPKVEDLIDSPVYIDGKIRRNVELEKPREEDLTITDDEDLYEDTPEVDFNDPENWVQLKYIHTVKKKNELDFKNDLTDDDKDYLALLSEKIRGYTYTLNSGEIPDAVEKEDKIAFKVWDLLYSESKNFLDDPDAYEMIKFMEEISMLPEDYDDFPVPIGDHKNWVTKELHHLQQLIAQIENANREAERKGKLIKNAKNEKILKDYKLKEWEYRYFLNTENIPEPRTDKEKNSEAYIKYIPEYVGLSHEEKMKWDYNYESYYKHRMEQDSGQNLADKSIEDIDTPSTIETNETESHIPVVSPIVPVLPIEIDKTKPTDGQIESLREYADILPDLAEIAHEAESYSAAEAAAVINDLAREYNRRQNKKTTTRRTSQRPAQVGPRSI